MSGTGESEVALQHATTHLTRSGHVASSEGRLLRDALAGAPEALDAIVRRHWRDAYRTAYLIVHDAGEAEDIAQEALVSALRAMHRFDRRRRFAPWLHRIVVNHSLDHLRSNRDERLRLDLPERRLSGEPNPAISMESLNVALDQLSPEDRAIVVLRHLFDYRAREIGRMMGLSGSTVRTRLQRSLKRLRDLLGEDVL